MKVHKQKLVQKLKNSLINSFIVDSRKTFTSNLNLSNKNLTIMKNLKNFRNNTLNVDIEGTDLIFQTIWSDFVHFSFFDRKFNNQDFNSEFDYSKYDEESYTIFQDDNIFTDYESMDKNCTKINYAITENEIKLSRDFPSFDKFTTPEIERDLTLITRIPQEFNLNLKSDKNIRIVNTGDSKIIADKQISIEFYNHNKNTPQALEAKRIRTTNFNLLASGNKFSANIRSYLEAEILNFVAKNKSNIRIKKLGVVKQGFFDLKETNLDIRSIYGPFEKEEDKSEFEKKNKKLSFNIAGGNLNFGSVQGNVEIKLFNSLDLENESYESNLFIDNIECEKFCFISTSTNLNKCEVFINKVLTSCVFELKHVKNFILFLNVEKKEDFVVRCNKSIIYGEDNYSKDKNDSGLEKSVIEITSESRPEIMEVSSWDYMKRRIERKRLNKV